MDGDLVPEPLELLGDRMSVIRARPSVAHDQCGLDWAMVPIEEDAAGTLSYSFRPKNPCRSGAFGDGRGWFRTSDLSRVRRALSH